MIVHAGRNCAHLLVHVLLGEVETGLQEGDVVADTSNLEVAERSQHPFGGLLARQWLGEEKFARDVVEEAQSQATAGGHQAFLVRPGRLVGEIVVPILLIIGLFTRFAGLILIAAGLLRLGALMRYMPQPVITGFTAGIAVSIFSSQVKDLFGLPIAQLPGEFLARWSQTYLIVDVIVYWAIVVAGLVGRANAPAAIAVWVSSITATW